MEDIFMNLVEMSVSASWLVLVVLALRLLLKKAPRWIHVCLWALVAVRLVCPFTFESAISLTPADLTAEITQLADDGYYGDSSIYSQGSVQYDTALSAGIAPVEGDNGYRYVITQPDDPTRSAYTGAVLWAKAWSLGVIAMAVYAAVSYLRLKHKVSASVRLDNCVCICDYIDTPFILGILKPRIYLPSSMEPDSASHVLAHERAHIARKDHWWKPLGYLLLTAHWFNPLLWLAYVLLCRDIELACDEKVIRDMELPQKKAYSEALLRCSVNRRMIAACPLAFGEVGVKERVKTVLNYKKPSFWIVLIAFLALIVTAVCFLTDPVREADVSEFFHNYVYEREKGRRTPEEVHFIDAKDGYALVYCSGMGPGLDLYQYEMVDGEPRITAYCGGGYTISGGMSMNHVEAEGKHIYYGTVSDSHYNPPEDTVAQLNWESLLLIDENGKKQELDMENAQGYLAILDAPLADFQVVSTEGVVLDYENYLSQGYVLEEHKLISAKSATDVFGEVYRVEKVVYRNPVLSYYMTEADAPLFNPTQGWYLKINDGLGSWSTLGEFSKIQLTEATFDDLFFGETLGMEEDITLAQIREDNRGAWILTVPKSENANSVEFYLLLWQYSGDVYLAQGIALNNVYPLHDNVLDASYSVNWLFRLNPITNEGGAVDTFGKYYRVNGKIYESPVAVGAESLSWDNVYLFTIGQGILEMPEMGQSGTSLARLSPVALTEANFDACFRESPELAAALRENNVQAWEYFTTHNVNADTFFYLLRQKDGVHYVACGGWDDTEGMDSARIGSVFRMYPITYDDPYQEAHSPFQWTLNLDQDHVESITISARDMDGNTVQTTLPQGELRYFLQVLNSVTPDQITLGTQDEPYLDADVLCLDGNLRDASLDVKLSYDGQSVGLTFSQTRYPQEVGKTWIIHNDWLNSFFFAYSSTPQELDPFADLDNAYQLCRNIRMEYVDFAWANEIVPDGQHHARAQVCDLSQQQITTLLDILNRLPESAFDKAEYPEGDDRGVNIFMRNHWNDNPLTANVELKQINGSLYYTFGIDWQNPYQTWKIESPELVTFLDSLFEGDRSDWDKFAPFPRTDGTVSCDFGSVEVTIPKLTCFQYQVSEDGLRFKPRDQEGWVLLQYSPEPYAADKTGLKTFTYPFGSFGKETCTTGYYDESEYWSFKDVTVTAGDAVSHIHLINEERAAWVKEYDDEISWTLLRLDLQVTG